jgi:hypothetical protein
MIMSTSFLDEVDRLLARASVGYENPLAGYTARRRPVKKLMTARMSATTKMILAMPAALAAIPANPKMAAMSAITKNTTAQYNMMPRFLRP